MKLLLLLASLQKTCEVQNIGYGHSSYQNDQYLSLAYLRFRTGTSKSTNLLFRESAKLPNSNRTSLVRTENSYSQSCLYDNLRLAFFNQSLLYSDLQFQLNSDKLFLKLCQNKGNFSCNFFRYTPDICYSFFTHYLNQSILMGKIVQNNI